MWKWLKVILGTLRTSVRNQHELALENLALRRKLATLKYRSPRPRLSDSDRLFWVVLSRFWGKWASVVHVVQLATVIRWHRQGFRYYWRWKSRPHGRPRIDTETRQLIRKMSLANPLWGAPRIHGELLKLGIDISETTVSKYVVRHCGPPSQNWRTFLQNHSKELISLDFLTAPTASFKILFVLVILSLTVAEPLRRTHHRLHSARVPRCCHRAWPQALEASADPICRLLQRSENAPVLA